MSAGLDRGALYDPSWLSSDSGAAWREDVGVNRIVFSPGQLLVSDKLSQPWWHIQRFLFPLIGEELGELTAKQKLLVSLLELVKLEEHLPYAGRFPGRPPEDRIAIARAFVSMTGDHTHLLDANAKI